MSTHRPIVIVTGANRSVSSIVAKYVLIVRANSGVGFGICHRLLVQLSQPIAPDAQPQFKSLFPEKAPQDNARTEEHDGLTLIMACRSQSKALKARTKLLRLLDEHVEEQRQRSGYDGYAERLRENVQINFHYVDMSKMTTVFAFCDELTQKYVANIGSLL